MIFRIEWNFQHTDTSAAHSTVILLLCLAVATTSTRNDEIVCQSKYFKAKCPSADEVVLVERARYGRMNLSRCVRENFGYIGCSNDVLDIVDVHCSGRRACSLRILDENFMNMKPCHEDLKSYLAVEYRCIKVVSPTRQSCLSNRPIALTQPRGLLASVVTSETGCGSAHAPWRIQVQRGQQVNVTLLDFSVTGMMRTRGGGGGEASTSGPSYPPPGPNGCRVYATLKEPTLPTRVTVCGGERRMKTVYISQMNAVDVQVTISSDPTKNYVFIIDYEAIGCPDVEAPPGGWVQRTENLVIFGCTRSTDTWQWYCRNQRWIGNSRNCTPEKLENSFAGVSDAATTITMSSGLLVVIILGMALAIGLLVLVVGIICLARTRYYNLDAGDHKGSTASSIKPPHDAPHLSKPPPKETPPSAKNIRQSLRLRTPHGLWFSGFRRRSPPEDKRAPSPTPTGCVKDILERRPAPMSAHSMQTVSDNGLIALDAIRRDNYMYSPPNLTTTTCYAQYPPLARQDLLSLYEGTGERVSTRGGRHAIRIPSHDVLVSMGDDGKPVSSITCNCETKIESARCTVTLNTAEPRNVESV